MRIISGSHKGRRLQAPKSLPVRPTTDMAKEGLMNILTNKYDIENLKILDLFSGTGNLSFELASRGAQDIIAVDSHLKCIKWITTTAKELGMDIVTVKMDAFKFLEKTHETFDLIFADPPYNFVESQFKILHNLIFENQLLEKDGLFIVEHATQRDLSNFENFHSQRKYGSSVFSFFQPEK